MKKKCFFCGEEVTEAIDLHHEIPQKITKKIPNIVRKEVLEEIFGRESEKIYPLCGSCHKKIHAIIKPFTKSIILFSDIDGPEKK